jgi:hypothetical protein
LSWCKWVVGHGIVKPVWLSFSMIETAALNSENRESEKPQGRESRTRVAHDWLTGSILAVRLNQINGYHLVSTKL